MTLPIYAKTGDEEFDKLMFEMTVMIAKRVMEFKK